MHMNVRVSSLWDFSKLKTYVYSIRHICNHINTLTGNYLICILIKFFGFFFISCVVDIHIFKKKCVTQQEKKKFPDNVLYLYILYIYIHINIYIFIGLPH